MADGNDVKHTERSTEPERAKRTRLSELHDPDLINRRNQGLDHRYADLEGPFEGQDRLAFAAAGGASGAERHRRVAEISSDAALGRWAREAGQPAEWAWPEERRVVGTRVTRIDGPIKATGRARYAFDVNRPRMCTAKMVRSPHARARIVAIDTAAAEAAPGVVAVHTVKQAGEEVTYHGDPVLAVAAETENQARDAARAARLEYEVLPAVTGEQQAMAPGAPRIREAGNVQEGGAVDRGDLDAALVEAAAVYEGEFTTQVQTHCSLETHGLVAEWDEDELTVWCSTQGVHSTRDGLAGYFDLPLEKVRVVTPVMGGGFGSKFGPDVQGVVAAELARAAGRPVKLMLERDEEHLDSGNRPSSGARVRVGADAEGRLVAFDCDTWGTGGIDAGAGFPLPYIYDRTREIAVRRRHRNVYINAGSARAMRAPGHPQGSFVMESVMDELAARLGLDPIELRKLNLPEDSLWQEQLDRAADDIDWKDRWHPDGDPSPGPVKQGLGAAVCIWGGGGRGTQGTCVIGSDGAVEMRVGTQDIGTGTRTIVSMVTAEILGLPLEAITPSIGDTLYPPSGPSGGSTTAASVAPAVRVTAGNALRRVLEAAAPELQAAPDELEAVDGSVRVRGDATRSLAWADACARLAATAGSDPVEVHGEWQPGLSSSGVNGCQLAAVSVDTDTGVVTVDRVVAYQDCGLVLNPLTAESQVIGGVIMGIGFALFEDRILDPASGRMLNPDFEFYMLPGPSDIPDIEVQMMDVPERGVIGLGEPPTIPTAAAIANAVANAIGVRVHSLPITPEKVLAALEVTR